MAKLTKKQQEAADAASAAQTGRSGDGGKSALQQLLGAAPPSLDSTQQPIGVPPGYVAQATKPYDMVGAGPKTWAREHTTTGPVPARYFEGDDYKPAGQSPEKIAAMQRELVAGGVLKRTGFQLGVWDEPTRAAYARVLATANASGVSADEALAQYKVSPKQGDDSGREPLVVKLTRPEDLQALLDKVAIKTLGRKPTAAEAEHFVSSYRAMEDQTQRSAYDMSGTGGPGGTIEGVPAAEDFAVEQLQAQHPEEAHTHSVLDKADEFFDLLKSPI